MAFFYSAGELLKSTFEATYLRFIAPLWETILFFVQSISDRNSYLIFLVVVMSGWVFALYLSHVYKITIETLKTALLELKSKEMLLIKSLLKQEQDYENHQTSCRAYKKFLASLMARQKEQARYVYTSLNVVRESLNNPIIKVSEKEREEIIHSCITVVKSLSNGFITNMKNEPVILKKLLEKVRYIFTEKISRSNIELEFVYHEDLSFNGDSLFTELILITLIGKSIYRTSKNEKVTIILKRNEGSLQLEIRDKGYALTNKEKFIEKAFNHFVTNEIFYTLCQENGLIYECLKANNGLNITTLVMPSTFPDIPSANVMQLFKKQTPLKRINN